MKITSPRAVRRSAMVWSTPPVFVVPEGSVASSSLMISLSCDCTERGGTYDPISSANVTIPTLSRWRIMSMASAAARMQAYRNLVTGPFSMKFMEPLVSRMMWDFRLVSSSKRLTYMRSVRPYTFQSR